MHHSTEKPPAIVFDDHLLFAESFAAILERLGIFHSVQVFSRESDYVSFLVQNYNKPIYLFLDYYLPEKNALSLINETRRLNKKARIIIISSVTTTAIIENIITYQPEGFLIKTSSITTVLECLQEIKKGKTYICPDIRHIVSNGNTTIDRIPFTARELEMLALFASGLSIAETANRTNLSRHTIVSHRRKMMHKINAKSIAELLAYARRCGLI